MRVDGQPTRTIRPTPGRDAILAIDQRWLPHRFVIERLADAAAVQRAIREMWVRGAPLIGATAAYGMALQARADAGDDVLEGTAAFLEAARPTAVNLAWAVRRMLRRLLAVPGGNALRSRGTKPTRSPRKTWQSTRRSAATASR